MSVKPERAALLYHLLLPRERSRVARKLTESQKRGLERQFQIYRERNREGRLRIEYSLHRVLTARRSHLPFLVFAISVVLMSLLLGIYSAVESVTSPITLLEIAAPLVLGATAPLSLYLLPPWAPGELFRHTLRMGELIYGGSVLITLIWLLAFIRMEEPSIPGVRLTLFTMLLLSLGAITAPLLEEIFFRELLPGPFPGVWPGHIFSAALFSGAHIPSSLSMALYYFTAGLLLSSLRIWSGALLLPVLIHAGANLAILWLDPR